ncbi:hypothetical protein D3C81_1095900 [compost metagenome]
MVGDFHIVEVACACISNLYCRDVVPQKRFTLIRTTNRYLHATANADVVVGVSIVNAAPHVKLANAVSIDTCPQVVAAVQVVAQQPGKPIVGKHKPRRHAIGSEVFRPYIADTQVAWAAVEVDSRCFSGRRTVDDSYGSITIRSERALHIGVILGGDLTSERASLCPCTLGKLNSKGACPHQKIRHIGCVEQVKRALNGRNRGVNRKTVVCITACSGNVCSVVACATANNPGA